MESVRCAVLLPGTGSDADFVARAFTPALAVLGVHALAIEPEPADLVGGYLRALDDCAARHGRILVGGVSIGAAVSVQWAQRNPGAAAGVLAALPAWTGAPGEAPAAVSARFTAAQLREHGLEAVVAQMRAGSPRWLADELERAWRSQWPELPTALEAAGAYDQVTAATLRGVVAPVGVAAATDDPIHPRGAASTWLAALPHAELREVSLAAIGADPGALGRTCVEALLAAARR